MPSVSVPGNPNTESGTAADVDQSQQQQSISTIPSSLFGGEMTSIADTTT